VWVWDLRFQHLEWHRLHNHVVVIIILPWLWIPGRLGRGLLIL